MTTPGLSPEDLQTIADMVRTVSRETITEVWSGQANVQMVTPSDLAYRGKGIYYSASEGWFSKGPGGSLLKLPGPPRT